MYSKESEKETGGSTDSGLSVFLYIDSLAPEMVISLRKLKKIMEIHWICHGFALPVSYIDSLPVSFRLLTVYRDHSRRYDAMIDVMGASLL